MSHSAQDREHAVQAITQRTMLERHIKRTQRRMATLQGGVPQALQDSLAADQAALAEAIQTVEAVKADMRQEEERRRWELQEELRHIARWRSSQFPPFPSGSVPSSPGQALGFIAILAVMAAIAGGVLLLNR